MPDPAVSIVIPTRNRPDYLRRCLTAVLGQTLTDLEVIVVDDASQPPVELSLPRTTVLRQEKHVHACRARNIAAGRARGRYLVCLDDDAELADTTALATAVAFADAHPQVGVVGFRQTPPDGGPTLNPGGDHVTGPALVGFFFGCGALLRRDVFDRIGGFTELLGYYYEELEYCMRVFDAGSLVAYHPDVCVIHHQDPTGRDRRRLHRLIARNALLTIAMRFPAWAVLPASVAQQLKYVRDQVRDPGLRDPLGTAFVLAGFARHFPQAWARRRTVTWAALLAYKRYQRSPEPIPQSPAA